MELNIVELFNGISEFVFVIVSLILGLLIILRYPKTKNRTYLLVGIVWIGISQPWFAGVVSLFYALITNDLISVELYLLIGLIFLPCTIFLWGAAFSDLIYKEKQNFILLILGLWGVIFEIIFIYYLINDSSSLATLYFPLVIEYKLFIQINLVLVISFALLTGIIFALKTRNINNPEQKLRGAFMLIAFITFTIGCILDTIFISDIFFIVFKRVFLIVSSFAFYFSFILPDWIKHIFLKKSNLV